MPLRLDGLTLTLSGSENSLRKRIAARLETPTGRIISYRILRKSLDARDKNKIRWVYTLQVEAADEPALLRRWRDDPQIRPRLEANDRLTAPRFERPLQPVIVGSGPAGLFAADLLARRGAPPLVLERGRPVDERRDDVRRLLERGALDPESNICFGEGGAGTFSDGKLTTRLNDPLVRRVAETFVALGAPGSIVYDAAPHLGSDRLPDYVRAFRERLRELGVEFRFGARVVDIVVADGRLQGLTLADGATIQTDLAILAIGHSAADLARALHARGVAMQAKAFAVGLRIEHPQTLIDRLQYGRAAGHPRLPPAAYRLTHKGPGRRGVYSFCMCPGGAILPAATDAAKLVVNGGSNAERSGPLANAAIVAAVGPDDFGDAPLAGLDFRDRIEAAAAELGDGARAIAPATRAVDFLAGRASASLPESSYRPGLAPVNLREALPEFVSEALADGLRAWQKRLPRFAADPAALVGVETRTSCPWRLVRGPDFQSANVRGLYVAGEGSGYAGGIVSSAIDGLRAALAIREK